MKKLIKFSLAAIFAVTLFTACSNESNPLDPIDAGNNGGDTVINTPKFLKIESITLSSFPVNKSNGDKWDYNVFPNSPTRRPDIYVELSKSGSNTYVYRSDIKEDAIFETAYDTFVFTRSQSSSDGSLPYSININDSYKINVWDDDGLTADDSMGSVTINAAGYYNNDNATNVYKTVSSSGITIKVSGRWIY